MSEAGVSASWDGVDDAAWDALLAAAPRCALQQGTDYGAALAARGRPVTRAVFRVGERVVALAQIVERRYLGIARVAALLRGPVWIDPALVERLAVLRLLRARWPHWRYRFLLVQPDEPESRELAAALAAIGVRRIVTGYSTSWVDLRPEEETLRRRLDGKWRNQLRRGEESGLSVDAGQTRERLDWLLAQDAAQGRAGADDLRVSRVCREVHQPAGVGRCRGAGLRPVTPPWLGPATLKREGHDPAGRAAVARALKMWIRRHRPTWTGLRLRLGVPHLRSLCRVPGQGAGQRVPQPVPRTPRGDLGSASAVPAV